MNTPSRKARNSATAVPNRSAMLAEYLQPHLGAIINVIREMVERESPSHNKQAVDALGEYLADVFRRAQARVTMHWNEKFGDHLQADFDGSGNGRVLLLGHYDTVWDVGTLKSMPFREEHGKLFGPGVLDMKTGIAQMLFAIDALRAVRDSLPRPITVLLVTDEEVGSEWSRKITERIAKDCAAVLVLEPSFGPQGALKTARKGVGDYTIRVHGVAAHAGLDPKKGANAILELSRQLLKLEKFTDPAKGTTVNPGVIRGGTRTNVVPAEASCEVDARIAKIAQGAALDRKFRALKPANKRCTIEIEGGINRPPLERTEAVAKLFHLAQRLGSETGLTLKEAAVGGGSDGNFTAALGIPTLDGLGAVGEGAHAVNESVIIDQLIPRTVLLARLLEEI
ncbi:MAG: M20 family metallopeptidase [Terriglobales bacterium]